MKLIVTYSLFFIIPGVILQEFDAERGACAACVASGDYAGAHARACCEDHNICCDPATHTNNPWGGKYSPGVCDGGKCHTACSTQRPGTHGNCDRETNYCECLGSDGACLNCQGKPGKCNQDACHNICKYSSTQHPQSVKGICNRSNNYCQCHSEDDRCLNC